MRFGHILGRRAGCRRSPAATIAALSLAALVGVAGCDGNDPVAAKHNGAAPTTPPTTLPIEQALDASATRPATKPQDGAQQASAVVQAPPSLLVMRRMRTAPNGEPLAVDPHAPALAGEQAEVREFPAAKLQVTTKGDDVVFKLTSDDPKEALSKKWLGDRYYFLFAPPSADPKHPGHMDNVVWRTTADYRETDETANGVYFQGDRFHLEPVDLLIRLEGDAPHVRVMVNGVFKQFDANDPGARAAFYEVGGILVPRVEVKD